MAEETDLTIRLKVDTSGVRGDLQEAQREAEANPLTVRTVAGGGTFAGESVVRGSGVVNITPASLSPRLPSESIPIIQAAGAAPYLVGPPGWQGVNPNTPAGMAAATAAAQPYGVAPVGVAGTNFPAGSIPLYQPPAVAPVRPVPYAEASTLPGWAQEAEDRNFGGPDIDPDDVAALGSAATGGDSGGGGRRRRMFRGLGGYYAFRRIVSTASGWARAYERIQDVDNRAALGTDPELDAQRAELGRTQAIESAPGAETAGFIYDFLGSRLGPAARRRVIEGNISRIERGRAAAEFETGLGLQRVESFDESARTYREAGLLGLTGTTRDRAAVDARSADEAAAGIRRQAELRANLNIAPDGVARDRAAAALSEFDRNRPGEVAADIARRNAALSAVSRGEAERGWAIANRAGAGILAARGQFGAADEEEFQAGLRQREADAARDDPANLGAVRGADEIARQARAARRDFRGERATAAAGVIDFRTAGDERAAILAQFADARRVAEAQYVGSERAGVLREIGAQETASTVQFADRRASLLAGLRDEASETGLLAEGRGTSAHAASIEDAVNRAAMNLRGPDAPEETRLIEQAGINRLKTARRDLENRGLLGEGQALPSGSSIGPGFQEKRPYEEDTQQGLRALTEAMNRLEARMAGAADADYGGGGADF